MFKPDAEYFRRRPQGIPGGDSFSPTKFVKRGSELQRLEQLSWPRSQSGEYATIEGLMAKTAQLSGQFGHNPNAICPCGCRREHGNEVPRATRDPNGRGFDVAYFSSNACKSKWNSERIGG
jgi:hypothetical protein